MADNKVAILLKQERIMTEIRKGVLELADDRGMTDEFILDRLLAIEELASVSKDTLNVALSAIKEMMKIRGVGIVKKETTSIGLIARVDPKSLDSIKRHQLLQENNIGNQENIEVKGTDNSEAD